MEDAQVEPCVGGSLLRISSESKTHILLHFSNELTERFALAAHYLRQRALQGEEAAPPDFSNDGQRCVSCGNRLLDPSLKVCPNCIQRGQVMRRLVRLAKPYWGLGGMLFALMLSGVMVDLCCLPTSPAS